MPFPIKFKMDFLGLSSKKPLAVVKQEIDYDEAQDSVFFRVRQARTTEFSNILMFKLTLELMVSKTSLLLKITLYLHMEINWFCFIFLCVHSLLDSQSRIWKDQGERDSESTNSSFST
ncbi:uncharacterized protein LOC103503396 isoform X1 [Cucumis melo]|uniref:Uncharacterized protein LOC103503396 isoform X1 n=1 Tax=Cucumis melo TaxID=3656 RepID=A0ABM3L6B9_CUCME|nr:uncharacterized protein LOC103503396 isoform X1 [Cucumis melo]XP_050945553.1 uncharacterized protein LOC103503396 isoform X1 [Cucumis melo]